MYWLIGRNSKLSLNNKLNIYKIILKQVWTYGIQLWGTASNSNLEITQRFQSKTLRMLLVAPCERYEERMQTHSNELARAVLDPNQITRWLKKFKPTDLRERFN
ncbi:hypothetical protein KPH14_012698 [Odynerus spinipes]|uniref:Uncharacterized protein n=1 Tax=Odynerus spinipes TaxID=1348599 RepID=A0AAD9VK86_9HYME|nr:hypothetical protein KPH14_012698 [Odynerus spinipes]